MPQPYTVSEDDIPALEGPENHLVKVVFVGDSGVGKTSMLGRLFTDTFNERTSATIGCDFRFKRYKFDNKSVGVTLWDTAGAEKFQAITSNHYRGAQGIVLVFDVTQRDSLQRLGSYWLREVDKYSTLPDAVKLIVGNKVDLADKRQVSPEEGARFAREHGCMYQECSAKTDHNVYDALVWGMLCNIVDTPTLLRSYTHPTLDLERYTPKDKSRQRGAFCWCT